MAPQRTRSSETMDIAELAISPSGGMKNRHTEAMMTPLLKLATAMMPCRRVSRELYFLLLGHSH